MKIGIDIDNVIANTYQDLYSFFDDFMGRKVDPNETVQILRKRKFLMKLYLLKAWRKKVMTTVSLIEGAVETIRDWHKKHSIHLVTSRLALFNRQTKDWLNKHNVPYHELHHAKETTKHKKIINCHVFIEDNLEECEVLAKHCDHVILFDQPWNQSTPLKENITRVKNWKEIRNIL